MVTVLITGAAGRTSGFVIRALLESGAKLDLRLLVRSEAAVERTRAKFPQLKRHSFVLGDYLEYSTLGPALKGVDIVFHNAPAFHSQETAMGIAVIDAAKDAGVKHFVYCSVLFPLLHKLLNHEVKLRVEEYLIESGLDYTILEPTCMMQNLNVKEIASSGILTCAWSPQVLQGYVSLQDLAEVARLVILDPASHNRARYEIVGQNITLEDVAKIISTCAGKPVECRQVPRAEAVPRGLVPIHGAQGAYAKEGLDRMLYYYDTRGIPGNNNTVRWLLGRQPTTWETFAKHELGKH
ncbi:hypothetical protein NM688_g5845 [Phlebia brevispora]|uniref:Uncharacterized protein n=1 Tax=Phlebia brevispora TaxID=194682 RepID=A0ACC1SNW5_9APHY|nr:hypothetical protein NM688_g5845 [Phlebia brevispora]